MDYTAVRQGLSSAAEVIEGLNCRPNMPDSIPAPCFYVGEVTIDYDRDFGGLDAATFVCRLLVGRADDAAAQQALDQYLKRAGSTSVKAALEVEPTLGGACDDLIVKRVDGHRLYTVGTTTYLGAQFNTFVIGGE